MRCLFMGIRLLGRAAACGLALCGNRAREGSGSQGAQRALHSYRVVDVTDATAAGARRRAMEHRAGQLMLNISIT